MRDYEFQAHFCSPIYAFHHRYCTGEEGEIAFELRQTGTWLMLDRINCRCLGVADVERYGYSKGVLPTDRVFRGNYIQMTCSSRVSGPMPKELGQISFHIRSLILQDLRKTGYFVQVMLLI